MLNRESRIEESKKLQAKFLHERANGKKRESLLTEREYLVIRKSLIDEVTEEVKSKKSLTFTEIKERVANRPKQIKRATGIRALDMQLVSDNEYKYEKIGGFTLGNFIQISGVKGSGKSTIMMKIMSGFSMGESVSWFDFEMGDEKAISVLQNFDHNDQNISYYEGSREIKDIVDEIKYLYADGVRHFAIDSMMKVNAKGYKRGYESFAYISSIFAELTSSLRINIYLINQMSQESQRNNQLMMKHGNDAEYDADYLFFVFKKSTGKKDEVGQIIYEKNERIVTCTKNRVDHRLFSQVVTKGDIFGFDVEEIIYE